MTREQQVALRHEVRVHLDQGDALLKSVAQAPTGPGAAALAAQATAHYAAAQAKLAISEELGMGNAMANRVSAW
jgi:hypothetical protein